jgi:hypothetical protein
MNETEDIRPLVEDHRRKEAMIDDILQRLNDDTQGQDRFARVAWVISHVREYLDRWIGAIRFYPVEMFLQNDLHSVLLIGATLAENEIQQLENHEEFKLKWRNFLTIVQGISKDSRKEIGEAMSQSLHLAIQELVEGERRQRG